mmetsp:Transcript_19505/g.23371  ORF Transcript_19505/g.23371 Transcript_19505/m.23371 type:complete len:267 (-) Transcript_19505:249-1049(-)|eukprot:CAMPEP_0197850476 /NCGR_PEP_ID=MMETSP1438-20131217/15470_1 /TAXON_ID=1461541 /ORGANISM="Pterosperma sp., Strain CCMP1384" /LENGTH=266 /DNA_ID=CAMNT_0043463657 /DNA_START=187 /DNA_END=987 /DNA_ORIENTATION=+
MLGEAAIHQTTSHENVSLPVVEKTTGLNPAVSDEVVYGDHSVQYHTEAPDWGGIPHELVMLTASFLPNTLGSLWSIAGVCSGWREAVLADKAVIARVAVRLKKSPIPTKGPQLFPRLLEESIAAGNAQAMMCQAGVYEDQNKMRQAQGLWKKAARAGHMEAQFKLGCLHYHGTETQARDSEQAVHWLQKAGQKMQASDRWEEDKERLAQVALMLGYMHMDGDGTRTDNAEAMKWMLVAKSCGSKDAESTLGWMYNTGQYGETIGWS